MCRISARYLLIKINKQNDSSIVSNYFYGGVMKTKYFIFYILENSQLFLFCFVCDVLLLMNGIERVFVT
ncbi:hypothetical protein D8W73_10260 [Citrobacter amalonaticus]|nr:hypothetical protein [Citrobacter amalonaticus]